MDGDREPMAVVHLGLLYLSRNAQVYTETVWSSDSLDLDGSQASFIQVLIDSINRRRAVYLRVCLKMSCTPKPNGFADHYPY